MCVKNTIRDINHFKNDDRLESQFYNFAKHRMDLNFTIK